MRKSKRNARPITELLATVASKLRPPFGIALGSPGEVAELTHALPQGDVTCWQMDLFQADRLQESLRLRDRQATIETRADLWDLPPNIQTLIYPVPYGGERALKLDVIEQAYHVLAPHGTFIVLSPYDHDDFFADALKKVFGRPHVPMEGENQVFWCSRTDDRPRRRHETKYHVRVDAETSYSFLSRPGVFGYGFYDEGARALMEAAELAPGQRVLDLGCGVGTNGVLAARRVAPDGHVTFVDSNVRAIALAEINAKAIGVTHYQTIASHTLRELADAAFDVVLANPPYYAQGAILHHFIDRSQSVLKPGGVMYLVTKQVDIAWPMIQERFAEPELFENRGYVIFRATKL
jgi:16S rRNA G1207 methylase RsmC